MICAICHRHDPCSAMSDQGGLAKLLIDKGVITREEYVQAITASMEREAASYAKWPKGHLGTDAEITLA